MDCELEKKGGIPPFFGDFRLDFVLTMLYLRKSNYQPMPFQLVFTPENTVQNLPAPVNGVYALMNLTLEANTLEGLNQAIERMRLYFRFDYPSPYGCFTKNYHLRNYVWNVEGLIATIEFEDQSMIVDPRTTCIGAICAVLDEVYPPVIRMVLTIDHTPLPL